MVARGGGVPLRLFLASAGSVLQHAGWKMTPFRYAKIGRFSFIAALRLMCLSQSFFDSYCFAGSKKLNMNYPSEIGNTYIGSKTPLATGSDAKPLYPRVLRQAPSATVLDASPR